MQGERRCDGMVGEVAEPGTSVRTADRLRLLRADADTCHAAVSTASVKWMVALSSKEAPELFEHELRLFFGKQVAAG